MNTDEKPHRHASHAGNCVWWVCVCVCAYVCVCVCVTITHGTELLTVIITEYDIVISIMYVPYWVGTATAHE